MWLRLIESALNVRNTGLSMRFILIVIAGNQMAFLVGVRPVRRKHIGLTNKRKHIRKNVGRLGKKVLRLVCAFGVKSGQQTADTKVVAVAVNVPGRTTTRTVKLD